MGCGLRVTVNASGFNDDQGGILYGHPLGCMYEVAKYKQLAPFMHHGAPCIQNMIAAKAAGFVVKNFPMLTYLTHEDGGTSTRVGGWEANVVDMPDIVVLDKQPWLSIVTRCYKRPHQFLRCMASIAQQTCDSYETVIIVDAVGRGVPWANAQFYAHRNRVRGKYVWLLDDDDECIEPDLVSMVRQIGQASHPEIIQCRFMHPAAVLPPDDLWGKPPKPGFIGGSSYIVRVDIWKRFIKHFADEPYAGDWTFLRTLWQQNYDVYWCDVVIGRARAQSIGAPEAALGSIV